jgi:hypothetical protein
MPIVKMKAASTRNDHFSIMSRTGKHFVIKDDSPVADRDYDQHRLSVILVCILSQYQGEYDDEDLFHAFGRLRLVLLSSLRK